MLSNKDLFKALTGNAERVKDYSGRGIKVVEADLVQSDKAIAVMKKEDGGLLVSSSRNVVAVIPLLKTMVEHEPVDIFVTATDIGSGKTVIGLELVE